MSKVTEKSVENNKKLPQTALDDIADYIYSELKMRKKKRKWLNDQMKDIDRQLRMEPDVLYKKLPDGSPDKKNAWMPEMELPNQSQTLEVLCADARRMMFPDSGEFFKAIAYAPDAFLENFKENTNFIVGSEIDLPSVITNENVNNYVEGWVSYVLKQFDHQRAWDSINSESFKYSMGVGRIRMVSKSIFTHDNYNTYNRSFKLPVLVPLPLKNVYLDDRTFDYMSSGAIVGPSVIFEQSRKLSDIQMEAKRQKTDDDFMSGGWITSALEGLEPDKNGMVGLIEYEGDIVVPKSGDMDDSMFIPNAIFTVICGKNDGKATNKLLRVQYNKLPSSSYIFAPYQSEHIDCAYGTSPLIKGNVVQKAASETLNRSMQTIMLAAQPPVKYSRDDLYFKAKGGPNIYPGAQWATEGDVETIRIGDPASMMAAYSAFLNQYSDVTGVNPPRLGAQTVSHTTAYAKDQEIERGTVRTVDYVRGLKNPMEKWLSMCYSLSRDALGQDVEQAYMQQYNAYVNVRADLLPEKVCFEAVGSGKPLDNAAKLNQQIQAIMSVIQLNTLAVQSGLAQPLNYDAIQRHLLSKAGITDVDAITTIPQGNAQGQPLLGTGQGDRAFNPAAQTIALQGLQRFR